MENTNSANQIPTKEKEAIIQEKINQAEQQVRLLEEKEKEQNLSNAERRLKEIEARLNRLTEGREKENDPWSYNKEDTWQTYNRAISLQEEERLHRLNERKNYSAGTIEALEKEIIGQINLLQHKLSNHDYPRYYFSDLNTSETVEKYRRAAFHFCRQPAEEFLKKFKGFALNGT